MDTPTSATSEFKPNIYPVMYWALAFGVTAGILLFLVGLLSRYITIVWFPVFLAGLVWGGYRNYKKQKQDWYANNGAVAASGTPLQEFKQAVQDITSASRTLMEEENNPPAPDEVQTEQPPEEESGEPAAPQNPQL